jgi:hypothetical protein
VHPQGPVPLPHRPADRPVAPGIARILTAADLDRAELLHGFTTRALLDGRLRVLPHRTTWVDARAARVASAVWRLCSVRCEEAGLGFAGVGPSEA